MFKKPAVRSVLVLSLAAVFAISASIFAAPRLELSETEFNFGYVPQNSKVSHTFWLKSTGDDSLKITRVVPGCGCTKAPLEKSELAAGDSTRLEIIFSTKRYKNRVSKAPKIETNEDGPPRNVRITTHVVANPDSLYPVAIRPYKMDISQFGEKLRDEMVFTITNRSEQEVEISLISSADDVFELELPRSIPAGGTAEGSLRLRDEALESEFEKSFTFEVNDEMRSRFTIPVKRTMPQLGSR